MVENQVHIVKTQDSHPEQVMEAIDKYLQDNLTLKELEEAEEEEIHYGKATLALSDIKSQIRYMLRHILYFFKNPQWKR